MSPGLPSGGLPEMGRLIVEHIWKEESRDEK